MGAIFEQRLHSKRLYHPAGGLSNARNGNAIGHNPDAGSTSNCGGNSDPVSNTNNRGEHNVEESVEEIVLAPTQALANPPPPAEEDKYKTFYGFALLPTELRRKIWGYEFPAAENQTLHLDYITYNNVLHTVAPKLMVGTWRITSAPSYSLLATCQESHAEIKITFDYHTPILT
ncbi:hypothetical protein G7Y89_g950 [Cudoniella acicularis]|uniref:2EXR domain-containing protein n=1 Tax=Cudoniella acicularis TaxID=354080 RepID=A0A8H4RW87_9HELO|nr:hypothetical protein G7Y89_g950 [Cudoniella acicularis]